MIVINRLTISLVIILFFQSCLPIVSEQNFEITQCSNEFILLGKFHSNTRIQHKLNLKVKSDGNYDIDLKLIDSQNLERNYKIEDEVEQDLKLDWYSPDCNIYYKCPCPSKPMVTVTMRM